MPETKSQKEILDAFQRGLGQDLRRASRRACWMRLARSVRIAFVVFASITFLTAFLVLAVLGLTRPVRYPPAATRSAEVRFRAEVEGTGQYRPYFESALSVLEKYPEDHATVVNVLDKLNLDAQCPSVPACVYAEFIYDSWHDMSPERTSEPVLSVSPRHLARLSAEQLAAILLHEADHVEWYRMDSARLWASRLRYNPLTGIFVERPFLEYSPVEIRAYKRSNEFLERCSGRLAPKSRAGKIERTKDSLVYRGAGYVQGQGIMVYVLVPGEAYEPYVKLWQGFADRQGAVVVAPFDWGQDMLEAAVPGAANKYGADRIVMTGFSNGGYNACAYGLAHPGQVAAIVPMGAYCRTGDISGPSDAKPPILAVAGANDDWALGEEGDFITNENAGLVKLGYRVNAIIVPGLGHALPTAAMVEVEEWLKKVIKN